VEIDLLCDCAKSCCVWQFEYRSGRAVRQHLATYYTAGHWARTCYGHHSAIKANDNTPHRRFVCGVSPHDCARLATPAASVSLPVCPWTDDRHLDPGGHGGHGSFTVSQGSGSSIVLALDELCPPPLGYGGVGRQTASPAAHSGPPLRCRAGRRSFPLRTGRSTLLQHLSLFRANLQVRTDSFNRVGHQQGRRRVASTGGRKRARRGSFIVRRVKQRFRPAGGRHRLK